MLSGPLKIIIIATFKDDSCGLEFYQQLKEDKNNV